MRHKLHHSLPIVFFFFFIVKSSVNDYDYSTLSIVKPRHREESGNNNQWENAETGFVSIRYMLKL